jgi:DNA-binding CsgD family transcriptional regulator
VSVRAEMPRGPHARSRRSRADRVELQQVLARLGSAPGELPTLFERLPVPAYVFDREIRIRWLNEYARRIFGDRVGRNALRYVAPEDAGHAREQFARKVVGGFPTEFALDVFDAEGGRLRLQISSVPLRSRDSVVGVFGVAVPAVAVAVGRTDPPDFTLTARQHEVLRLLDEGLGTTELAARLGVTVETARNHVRAVLLELGVHSRLEAVAVARRYGLLYPN